MITIVICGSHIRVEDAGNLVVIQMSDIDNTMNNLRRLTQELAEEIKYDEVGPMFKFCKLIFDNLKTKVVIIDTKGIIKYMNKTLLDYASKFNLDLKVGNNWYIPCGFDKEPEIYPAKEAIENRQVIHAIFKSKKTGNTLDIIAIPLIFNGVSGAICLLNQAD